MRPTKDTDRLEKRLAVVEAELSRLRAGPPQGTDLAGWQAREIARLRAEIAAVDPRGRD